MSTSEVTSPTEEVKSVSIVERIKEKVDLAFASLKKLPVTTLKRKASDNTQQEYISRLVSFQKYPGHFSSFPDKISPVIFAKYGWSVYNDNTVKCINCSSFLSVKIPLPNKDNTKEIEYAIKYITSHLKSAHKLSCKWSSKIICQLPEQDYNFNETFEVFKKFLKEPLVDIKMVLLTDEEGSGLMTDASKTDLKDYLNDDEASCLLSLFGWNPFECYIHCRFCAIKYSVKPYILDKKFDPLKNHERFCPIRLNRDDHIISIMLRMMSGKPSRNVEDNLRSSLDFIEGFKFVKKNKIDGEENAKQQSKDNIETIQENVQKPN